MEEDPTSLLSPPPHPAEPQRDDDAMEHTTPPESSARAAMSSCKAHRRRREFVRVNLHRVKDTDPSLIRDHFYASHLAQVGRIQRCVAGWLRDPKHIIAAKPSPPSSLPPSSSSLKLWQRSGPSGGSGYHQAATAISEAEGILFFFDGAMQNPDARLCEFVRTTTGEDDGSMPTVTLSYQRESAFGWCF